MKYLLYCFVFLLAGCAASHYPGAIETTPTMPLIEAAAEAAPQGIEGEFTFKITAAGTQRDTVYLNTEADYRDQRNITIAIAPSVADQLAKRYQTNPTDFFVGKFITVTGKAKRVRIDFYSREGRTDKYYYQTHIRITDINQIKSVIAQD